MFVDFMAILQQNLIILYFFHTSGSSHFPPRHVHLFRINDVGGNHLDGPNDLDPAGTGRRSRVQAQQHLWTGGLLFQNSRKLGTL